MSLAIGQILRTPQNKHFMCQCIMTAFPISSEDYLNILCSGHIVLQNSRTVIGNSINHSQNGRKDATIINYRITRSYMKKLPGGHHLDVRYWKSLKARIPTPENAKEVKIVGSLPSQGLYFCLNRPSPFRQKMTIFPSCRVRWYLLPSTRFASPFYTFTLYFPKSYNLSCYLIFLSHFPLFKFPLSMFLSPNNASAIISSTAHHLKTVYRKTVRENAGDNILTRQYFPRAHTEERREWNLV